MRIDPSTFQEIDLRVHTFLGDVPIHDVVHGARSAQLGGWVSEGLG